MFKTRQFQRRWTAAPSATIIQVLHRADESLVAYGLPRFARLSEFGVLGQIHLGSSVSTSGTQDSLRGWPTVTVTLEVASPVEDIALARKLTGAIDTAMDKLLAQPISQWEFVDSLRDQRLRA